MATDPLRDALVRNKDDVFERDSGQGSVCVRRMDRPLTPGLPCMARRATQAVTLGGGAQQDQVSATIGIVEERIRPPVAALRDACPP